MSRLDASSAVRFSIFHTGCKACALLPGPAHAINAVPGKTYILIEIVPAALYAGIAVND